MNYNREEPPRRKNGEPSAGRGISDEKPIAVPESKVVIRLPEDQKVSQVKFLTPESREVSLLEFQVEVDRLSVTLPEFLVYGVLLIE